MSTSNHPPLFPASVYLQPAALERECRSERLRRSGPGGQHRNKVETAVRFYHLATGLIGEASERRSQAENRAVALERLRIELALNVRSQGRVEIPTNFDLENDARLPKLRSPETFRWFAKLVGNKIRVAPTSFDYAILVSEFFDVFTDVDEDLAFAATLLSTSPTQLVRLMAAVPKCLEALNRRREKRGIRRLRP